MMILIAAFFMKIMILTIAITDPTNYFLPHLFILIIVTMPTLFAKQLFCNREKAEELRIWLYVRSRMRP